MDNSDHFELDHFELFGIPARFDIAADELDAAYRELQRRVHPDRFANASDAERRVAMQRATRANEAYQTLRAPLKRAIYMLARKGRDVRSETHTAMDPAFLGQQLEWREAIADARAARDLAALQGLGESLGVEKRLRHGRLESLLAADAWEPAAEAARQLLFIEKVEQEIGDGIEALESA
jgi:molecular chaperone HscB